MLMPSLAHGPHQESRTISVTAGATLKRTADKVNISFNINNTDKSPSVARKVNNENSAKVLTAIKELGIPEGQIRMAQFSINEDYRYNNQSHENELIGYKASKDFDVEVFGDDSELLNETLAALITIVTDDESGRLQNVEYGLKEDSSLINDALAIAVQRAKIKAEAMLKVLNAELGEIQSISETSSYHPPVVSRGYMMKAMTADFSEAGAYNSGDINVEANVDVKFRIAEPKKIDSKVDDDDSEQD